MSQADYIAECFAIFRAAYPKEKRNDHASQSAEVLAFSPQGDLVGSVAFPRPGLLLQAATLTTVWATETDDDGFVSIVRFRVVAPR